MALVFGDSFDHYLYADMGKKWLQVGNYGNSGIHSTYALSPHIFGLNAASINTTPGYFEKALPAAQETFIAGVWFQHSSFANAGILIAGVDGAAEHVSVRYDVTGHITFTRNATVLATSTNTMSINTWYHIEVKATIGDAVDSPSGRYEVRVNGSATGWIADSGVGQDTRNAGNKSINYIRLYCRSANSAAGHWYQDFYILNTTGAVASDFLGMSIFTVLRPQAAGNSTQWSGNYAQNWLNVSEVAADGDTTFNQSSTAAQIDLFVMNDIPTGTVHAIQHVIMARQDTGSQRTIRPKTRISTTNYNGTSVNTSVSFSFITEAVSISPATSSAWDDDEINAAEFGYELVS